MLNLDLSLLWKQIDNLPPTPNHGRKVSLIVGKPVPLQILKTGEDKLKKFRLVSMFLFPLKF